MADTVSLKARKAHVLHTPTGFLVFNEGKTTHNIPKALLPQLERDGVVGEAGVKSSDPDAEAGGRASLTGKNKEALLKIAEDEDVTTAKDAEDNDVPVAEATNAQIIAAIEAKRSDAPPAE